MKGSMQMAEKSYNVIDTENDTLTVIRAKVDAMAKALRKRAAEATGDEQQELNDMLNKPLGEWP